MAARHYFPSFNFLIVSTPSGLEVHWYLWSGVEPSGDPSSAPVGRRCNPTKIRMTQISDGTSGSIHQQQLVCHRTPFPPPAGKFDTSQNDRRPSVSAHKLPLPFGSIRVVAQ